MGRKIKYVIVIFSIFMVVILGRNVYAADEMSFFDQSSLRDDFDFHKWWIFLKSNWERTSSDANIKDCAWKPENVNFIDGKLVLTADNIDGNLSGGEISTYQKYGFGLYQVSMKPIKNSGVVSAFFNYYKENESGTEIDIEFIGKDTTIVQFNYFTNGVGGHEYCYDLGFDASEDFHVYGFYWTGDSIKWYVDGQQVHESTTDIPQHEAAICIDASPGCDPGWAGEYDGKAPLYAYYDWISFSGIDNMN
jgi:beta-glucanase (GH16 family)